MVGGNSPTGKDSWNSCNLTDPKGPGGCAVETAAIHLKDTAVETAAVLAETAAVLVAKTAADNKHWKSRALETAAFLIQLYSVAAEKSWGPYKIWSSRASAETAAVLIHLQDARISWDSFGVGADSTEWRTDQLRQLIQLKGARISWDSFGSNKTEGRMDQLRQVQCDETEGCNDQLIQLRCWYNWRAHGSAETTSVLINWRAHEYEAAAVLIQLKGARIRDSCGSDTTEGRTNTRQLRCWYNWRAQQHMLHRIYFAHLQNCGLIHSEPKREWLQFKALLESQEKKLVTYYFCDLLLWFGNCDAWNGSLQEQSWQIMLNLLCEELKGQYKNWKI